MPRKICSLFQEYRIADCAFFFPENLETLLDKSKTIPTNGHTIPIR